MAPIDPGSAPSRRGALYRSATSGAPDAAPDATLVAPAVVEELPEPLGLAEPPGLTGRPQVTGPGAPAPTGVPSGDGEAGSAAGHSAVMALGSLVSRVTGFLRTAVLAAALGGGAVGDAYTTAQFFPGMIYELLLGGILTSVVVPVLVRARKSDPDRGQAYAQRLLSLAVLALGAATVLAVVAAPGLTVLYAGDSTPDYQRLVTALSYLILPTIFFFGLSALLGAVLNTRGRFGPPMWTPILNNVVVIATGGLYLALFGVQPIRPEQMTPARIAVIGGGTLLGIVVQSAGLWPALRRVGFRWRWRFDFRALGLAELGRLGGWMFCYVVANQVGVLVLLNLLNRANRDGNVAGVMIYNNVYLLMMMAHGIVAVSIITALLPRMSAAAADRRYGDVTADLNRGTRMAIAVLAPVAVCYAVLAQPAMITLFERGAFTRDNSADSAEVLLVAAFALIPFAISQLFTFAFYALPDTRTPALINIPVGGLRVAVQITVYVAFTAAFTAAGLMIGNAVSYLLGIVLSSWLLRRRLGRIGLRSVVVTGARVLAAGLGAALVGLLALRMLPGGADPDRLSAAVQLVVGGVLISVSYLGFALALRVREVSDVVALVRRKLGR